MSDSDIKKDFDEAYDAAQAYWSPYLTEAKTDMDFMAGDQWDATAKKYLEAQRRSALSFNKIRRVVKLIEGYQRKNRLALKISPVDGSDDATASQLSAIVLWQMQSCNGYNVLSDAFSGALKTGANLVQIGVDYSQDPLNGDIRLYRTPYNRFLLDPAFSARDLSDCGYVIRRELMTKDAIRSILPQDARDAIKDLKPSGVMDTRFAGAGSKTAFGRKDLMRYDEFWRRTYRDVTVLVDQQSGQIIPWEADEERLMMAVQASGGALTPLRYVRSTVEQVILVEDIVVHVGPEPCGLDDYPFVPILGFYEPEMESASLKLQGIVRCMRDPQTEVNKRRSKMLDMIDSQIASGWKAKENSVVNPDALYKSGQGQVIWMKGELTDAEKLLSADIPPGLLQLSEILDQDIMEIPGANSELMGMPESNNVEVAGMLAKMRQGQGLTILQDIFDNYRMAKRLMGQKLVKVIQNTYTPMKIYRITGDIPTQEFFNRDFGKYDCVPEEGVLTDTQRQMSFSQLIALRQMGMPIPWEALLDAAPIENKDELKKQIQEAEKKQAEAMKIQQMMMMLEIQGKQADIKENQANARRDNTQAAQNQTKAAVDIMDTLLKMQESKTQGQHTRIMDGLSFLIELSNALASQAAQGQGANT